MTLSRRTMFTAATASALLPLVPGVRVARAAEPSAGKNIFVFVFLRDGMDGLQLVAPSEDKYYRDNRPTIAVRSEGLNRGLQLGQLDGVPFFLHPAAGQLKVMYDSSQLAVVHAAGVPTYSRSHFESQALVDKGIGSDEPIPASGWLTRHLAALPNSGGGSEFTATADMVHSTSALLGALGTVPTYDLEAMPITVYPQRAALIGALNGGDAASAVSTRQTLKLIDEIRVKAAGLPGRDDYGNYTLGPLSQKMRSLARALKLDLGIEVAVVDYGGVWDTHQNIAQYFTEGVRELSNTLFAFNDDLGALMNRVTVVIMTEFGRRVEENASAGTDHGEASVMLALGAGINGGKIYGQWPGLADTQLVGGDLHVTTDYRQVLSEVLVNRMGQTTIEAVFPTIKYAPLGLARKG